MIVVEEGETFFSSAGSIFPSLTSPLSSTCFIEYIMIHISYLSCQHDPTCTKLSMYIHLLGQLENAITMA